MNLTSRNSRRTGSSLIEILVVIVIFLVGILGVIQMYPGGLAILRNTRTSTMAANLVRSEIERLKGQAGRMADQIVPVSYAYSPTGVVISVDAGRQPRDLMPAGSKLDSAGYLLDGAGKRIGYWPSVSGANLFNRVLGEGNVVPAPRYISGTLSGTYGGLMTLQFAPLYYQRDAGTGISNTNGLLELYANDLTRRYGNRLENNPDPFRRADETAFTFVADEDTESGDPFADNDQVWIAKSDELVRYRIQFAFGYGQANEYRQYEIVTSMPLDPNSPPPYAQLLGNYWVISLNELIAQNGLPYDKSQYHNAIPDSIVVARAFNEIPLPQDFAPDDPYEYKVLSANTGFLLINPKAQNFRVMRNRGREPLTARVDYTVFDWRIIKDEFRVPSDQPYQQKLAVSSIKVKGMTSPDNLRNTGLGVRLPSAPNQLADLDFAVMDMETGGVFLPGTYRIDYTNGVVAFVDEDGDPANGLLGSRIVFPTLDPNAPWSAPVVIPDVRGRSVRALYMANGEWAPQVMKASAQYRVSVVGSPQGLQTSECFVGGSNPNFPNLGLPRRLYFPFSEAGKKVTIGEIWYRYKIPGSSEYRVEVLPDQEYSINLGNDPSFDRPYIDFYEQKLKSDFEAIEPGYDANNVTFDYTNGYSVRRVRGVSVSIRLLWNPTVFKLSNDTSDQGYQDNFRALERWMQSTRRTETETFLIRSPGN